MPAIRRIGFGIAALLVLMAGSFARSGPAQEAKKEVTSPEKVVQEQVEAYNRRDLEAFLKTYSPGIKLYTFPNQELATGLEAMRKDYGKMFADNPGLKVKIAKRIVQGDYVIDQEEVDTGKQKFTAVAVYQVKDGKITEVRFVE